MYKLYTDKQENFECKLKLEGASLKEAFVRLILESEDMNLIFKGTIDSNGKCNIPIKKLRGILGESTKGEMKLEVVAEDVYFQPWQSEFIVESARKLKVEVVTPDDSDSWDAGGFEKPKLTLSEVSSMPKPKKIVKTKQPINVLISGLNKRGITLKDILKKKKTILPFLERYANKIGADPRRLIQEVVYQLSNKK